MTKEQALAIFGKGWDDYFAGEHLNPYDDLEHWEAYQIWFEGHDAAAGYGARAS